MGRTPKEVIIFQGRGASSEVLEEIRSHPHFRGNTQLCLTGTEEGVKYYFKRQLPYDERVVILAVGFQAELLGLIEVIKTCYKNVSLPIIHDLAVDKKHWKKKLRKIKM